MSVTTTSQHAVACSWTQLPGACRHSLVCCMDCDTRAAWRLVNRQACRDVYDATRRLVVKPREAPMESCSALTVFAKCPRLQHLESCQTPSLEGLPYKLQGLTLKHCHDITDWAPLQQCTKLQELSFQGSFPKDTDSRTSFLSTLSGLSTLHSLAIQATWDRPATAASFGQAVARLSQLRSLTMRDHIMGPLGSAAFCPALVNLGSLTHLDLSGVMGPQGTAELAKVLGTLTSLEVLRLDRCSMVEAGVSALAPELLKLTSLCELHLCGNTIRHEGTAALAPVVSQLTRLATLGLARNHLYPAGVEALAPCLKFHPSLTSLDLSNNRLQDEGMEPLAPVLGTMSLRHLNLMDNWLSADSVALIQGAAAALPDMTLLINVTPLC